MNTLAIIENEAERLDNDDEDDDVGGEDDGDEASLRLLSKHSARWKWQWLQSSIRLLKHWKHLVVGLVMMSVLIWFVQ
jgi:hypothetical protein